MNGFHNKVLREHITIRQICGVGGAKFNTVEITKLTACHVELHPVVTNVYSNVQENKCFT